MGSSDKSPELLEKCEECRGSIIKVGSQKVCKECGLIASEILQDTSHIFVKNESSYLGKQVDRINTLGSEIGSKNDKILRDGSNKLLSPKSQRLFNRLKSGRFNFKKGQELEHRILKSLYKASSLLDLPRSVRKDAAFFYKKIKNAQKRVINNISLIGFCLYHAIKNNPKIPVTVQDIINAFDNIGHRLSPKLIYRDFLKYGGELKTSKKRPHKSEDFIPKFVSSILNEPDLKVRIDSQKMKAKWTVSEYGRKLRRRCYKILAQVTSIERGGRNPKIFAAAVLYAADISLARDFNRKKILTQQFISKATGIGDFSIRDHFVNVLKPRLI